MHLTLLESDRNFFRSAEFAFASIMAHVGVIWLALGITDGGRKLPANEREARVFFLLPPDRVDVRPRQSEVFRLGKLGGGLDNGDVHAVTGADPRVGPRAYGARQWGERGGPRDELPFGPVSSLVADTVFSVLQVDRTVERFDGSAAPVYPAICSPWGRRARSEPATSWTRTGRVDMETIHVMSSDDPRFTESVRTALGLMLFRWAEKAERRYASSSRSSGSSSPLPLRPAPRQTSCSSSMGPVEWPAAINRSPVIPSVRQVSPG